jgi:hypothetical protein
MPKLPKPFVGRD